MNPIDCFNGDADGLCALHQLRLAEPAESELVTGVKRDIQLLERIRERCDCEITVLDISLDSNRDALQQLLEQGNHIRWFDHHFSGEIPDSPLLHATIHTSPEVCTSLLVNQELAGKFREWALTAAFGDNLYRAAQRLAEQAGLDAEQQTQLRELGELLNYNGYGETVADLHFPPDQLFRHMQPHESPWSFIHESEALPKLREGYRADQAQTETLQPESESLGGRVFRLPCEPWCRRVVGVFSNRMAREHPELAHAVLVDTGHGTLVVSVRAPLESPQGADALCRKFDGGGRAGAAGINALPDAEVERFLAVFAASYPGLRIR
ncbi:MAG TPA: acetyltransferase [Candidatus Lambdaproteobacteria bacterium]|nr:acetyltransferase [Candidatus Lambdaproteobacteria bacterium]